MHERTVVTRKAEECGDVAQAVWSRPIANCLKSVGNKVDTIDRYQVAKELNVPLE